MSALSTSGITQHNRQGGKKYTVWKRSSKIVIDEIIVYIGNFANLFKKDTKLHKWNQKDHQIQGQYKKTANNWKMKLKKTSTNNSKYFKNARTDLTRIL